MRAAAGRWERRWRESERAACQQQERRRSLRATNKELALALDEAARHWVTKAYWFSKPSNAPPPSFKRTRG